MHGVPQNIIDHATYADLMVMWEIVKRDMKDQMNIQAGAIGMAFGGDDK